MQTVAVQAAVHADMSPADDRNEGNVLPLLGCKMPQTPWRFPATERSASFRCQCGHKVLGAEFGHRCLGQDVATRLMPAHQVLPRRNWDSQKGLCAVQK